MRVLRLLLLSAAMVGAGPALAGGAAPAPPFIVLVAEADAPLAPLNLSAWRGQSGQSLTFTLTGGTTGAVWGDDIYSDDSSLSAAAVHAGVLRPGETGVVTVELLGAQTGFGAASRNGIRSNAYGAWDGSFRFTDAAKAPSEAPSAMADPGNLLDFASQVGEHLQFQVVGATTGSVYGDGIYTADSKLAHAAVHEGLVAPGETAIVTVEILGPQESFTGSDRNGATSYGWGAYPSAFRFVTPEPVHGLGPAKTRSKQTTKVKR